MSAQQQGRTVHLPGLQRVHDTWPTMSVKLPESKEVHSDEGVPVRNPLTGLARLAGEGANGILIFAGVARVTACLNCQQRQ
jgi:hypothetical protein